MEKITLEMPMVSNCQVSECGFNTNSNCHAKAITVGDNMNPGCDTFMDSDEHTQERVRIAGVGACKVGACRYNEDFECMAQTIAVGYKNNEVKCLTFSSER